jgi:formyltetrahydrofolate deformylase
MPIDIVGVIGNYDILEDLAQKFNVPFYTVSHEGLTREEHEEKILELMKTMEFDYVVLAKFMRVLTPNFVNSFKEGTLINIHHSFLPAFIGAKPYQQAFDRGVKIIGATAHFVTNNLDEGPIIAQDVIKVNHNYTAESMAKAGRDVERQVLNRALSRVIENKVFVHGNKTVVF